MQSVQPTRSHFRLAGCLCLFFYVLPSVVDAQQIQFPGTGLRYQTPSGGAVQPSADPVRPMRPIAQSTPSLGAPSFDPYASATAPAPILPLNIQPSVANVPPANFQVAPTAQGVYPNYTGQTPTIPGVGPSGVVGNYPNTGPVFGSPGTLPNSAPSALYPALPGLPQNSSPGLFGGFFDNLFGSGAYQGGYSQPANNFGGGYGGNVLPPTNSWNPNGTVFGNGQFGYPAVVRFFQGPRIRHGWVYGNDDADGLMINDTDIALAFAIPNFFYSTQPLYLLPSFSIHNWDGPHPNATADLPPIAYSAFLDAGWQSDPNRILGAELGMRVGMFSDFDTAISDSLRILGRGIGRIRLTPRATLKLGVMYIDRNRIKLLPAGGLLWQPNPDTRFDIFFPEPKLSHYVSTIGNMDTWWYVGGYYGGGSWTVERAGGTQESIDINDLRLVLGVEWGRNELIRQGKRFGFFEVGFVFDRELRFDVNSADNLSLQDAVTVRAGFGY